VISGDDVRAAAARLNGVAHRTPIFESRRLNERLGGRIVLKAENLQRTGSFKFRGAYNAVSQLTPTQQRAGVVAISSGNHAQGVALAAKLLGVSATIVMPHDAPPNKVAATEGYGATVVGYDRYGQSREALGDDISEREGRTLIHPYDNPQVMAGQGTTALELLDQEPELDALAVCLGGGGLLSGCATIAAEMRPGIELFGVEPLAGNDHARSRDAGERVDIGVPVTIADGQQVTAPGALTWPITNHLATAFPTATDGEIVYAMRLLFEQFKLVVEPSGASALAAVLNGQIPVEGRTVAVTLSGGNVSAERFAELVDNHDR